MLPYSNSLTIKIRKNKMFFFMKVSKKNYEITYEGVCTYHHIAPLIQPDGQVSM